MGKKTKKRRNMPNNELNKRLLRMLIFLIRFNLLAIPMYLIILSGFQWVLLLDVTTGISYGMLRMTGIDAAIEDSHVITVPTNSDRFRASIDWDCTGWKSMFALFALIFATNFPIRRRLAGLVLIPVIYLINLVRIWFMFFFVSEFGLTYYAVVHTVIWSWGLIFAVLLLWVVWMKKDISKLKIPTRIK